MDDPENLPDPSLQAKSNTWVAETAQVSWTEPVLNCDVWNSEQYLTVMIVNHCFKKNPSWSYWKCWNFIQNIYFLKYNIECYIEAYYWRCKQVLQYYWVVILKYLQLNQIP